MNLTFHFATADDTEVIQRLERSADALYQTLPQFAALNDSAQITDDLPAAFDRGAGVLIASSAGEAVGMLYFEPSDFCLYIKQISVHPGHQRQGVGRQMLEEFWREATGYGLGGVTLSTFADVPWNQPFYESLGYRVLAVDVLGPDLRARHEEDQRKWSAYGVRVTMGRFVDEH